MTLLSKGDRIYRYTVPVDDEWHVIELAGDPLFVYARQMTKVEFWARANDNHTVQARVFRVFGTGQDIDDAARYWGTAVVDPLVWHLVEAVREDAQVGHGRVVAQLREEQE